MVLADNGFAPRAVACALALVLSTLGAVVLFPGQLDPWVAIAGPFTRLAGTWIAFAAAMITAIGLLAIAARTRLVDDESTRPTH